MTTTLSTIEEVLDIAGLSEVAYRRTDRECGYGQVWDITLPDEQTTVRVADDDGQIFIIALTNGAMLEDGKQTFSHAFAAPTFVAAALTEIIGYYS